MPFYSSPSLPLIASSSSSSPQVKRFDVFPSFHGQDVRKSFLSHVRDRLASKCIKTFNDQEIERGNYIGPDLVRSIRESRISLVILSKNYASSSWCLDELDQIFKCKEEENGMVMTVFYDVDPSHVRKQEGDFGGAFMRTCEDKSEEVIERWRKVLTDVANIEGEHCRNWTSESDMIQKLATDVLTKLVRTPSKDFEGLVGMEAHLSQLSSLLCLESDDEVKMIGICGPAGIGKTTTARALFNLISDKFPHTCFLEDVGDIHRRLKGVGSYDTKKALHSDLLSTILSPMEVKVHHLGAVKERLGDQRVFIVLDGVDDLEQLEVLADEPSSWFGHGSRIIVTTWDKKILKAHMIKDVYCVGFPAEEEALEILCLSAFKQRYVPDGFEEIAREVSLYCDRLPLALRVVGSSLRGDSKEEWERQITKFRASLDSKVENVLRVGYDRLSNKDKSIFLHIACFFDYSIFDDVDYVKTMLADSDLDVENGLDTLIAKSLVDTSDVWLIKMHSLLIQLGRQIVHEESDEPGKRRFLVEAKEIRDVLTKGTGTGSIIGISLYPGKTIEFSIGGQAFKGMDNLNFLKLYDDLGLSEDLEYLPRLRLLKWYRYPRKSLPPTFRPDCLIDLDMFKSNLEKLWDGIQPLPYLKKINLEYCIKLKEIPNLLEATNLEILYLDKCKSLVELPSSIRNLQKLVVLNMNDCTNLRVIPTNINLASLEHVEMNRCSQLRTFPDFCNNVKTLELDSTGIKDIHASAAGRMLRLGMLAIGGGRLMGLTHAPKNIWSLDLSYTDIKRIPDCVVGLPNLRKLKIRCCRKLVSVQSLPSSILQLCAIDCESLESITFSGGYKWETEKIRSSREVDLRNCMKLDEETRRTIIQRWVYKGAVLPGNEIPAEFTHRATENSISISEEVLSVSSRFKACIRLSPSTRTLRLDILLRSRGVLMAKFDLFYGEYVRRLTEHMLVFYGTFEEPICLGEISRDIQFDITNMRDNDMIIECGIQILEEEGESGSGSQSKEYIVGATKSNSIHGDTLISKL